MTHLDELRATYESRLLQTEGVVGVGRGTDTRGRECLKIYTSEPPDAVRARLPEELLQQPIDIVYTGEFTALG